MTVRWVVEHTPDQLATGGWVEYPDEHTARAHAGTDGRMWALVTPEAVRVVEEAEARARRRTTCGARGMADVGPTHVPGCSLPAGHDGEHSWQRRLAQEPR
jgi:hypothetical protein